jgi:prevent-host-death family protein
VTVIPALADAQLHLGDLVDHIVAGEEIIMVKAGRPVACLVPMDPVDQGDPAHRRPRTLQAGFSDPAATQVQWAGAA